MRMSSAAGVPGPEAVGRAATPDAQDQHTGARAPGRLALDALAIVRDGSRRYVEAGVTTAQNGYATQEQMVALDWLSWLGVVPIRVVVWPGDVVVDRMLAGEFDFGFAVDWMRKDLAMALEEASRHGVPLPVTELVDGFYAEVQRLGGGRFDTSSLLLGLEDRRRCGTRLFVVDQYRED